MLFKEFKDLIDFKDSIILLEGKRKVHPYDQPKLSEFGELLCNNTNHVKFRSGNADGADYWFCKGVANADPKRLELILPYSAHRKKYLLSDNIYSLDKIDLVKEPEVIYQSISNSKNSRLIELYVNGERGRAGIKGSYLLRDTIKVIGTITGLPKASFAIFYDDLNEPKSGGTGHTIMICEFNNVPYIDQKIWMKWLGN